MTDRVSRRAFLGGVGGAVAGAWGLPQLAAAAADTNGLEPVRYGIAALTGNCVSARAMDGKLYVLSRAGAPTPRLGEIDLSTMRLSRTITLPGGTAGWSLDARGGKVYAGAVNYPRLVELDAATGAVREVGDAVGPASNIFIDVVVAGDGMVYVGTYPRGECFEINPATGATRLVGKPSTSQYARLAVDDTYVYVGTLAPGKVIAYRRDGSGSLDLSPQIPSVAGGVAKMLARDGVLHVATGNMVTTVHMDGRPAVTATLPPKDSQVDVMTFGGDGQLHVAARRTCTAYRVEGDQMTDLGTAMSIDDGNAGIAQLDDGNLLGVAGTGTVWQRDASGSFTTHDLVALGFALGEPVQSMLRDSVGRIWAGGSFRMNVHDVNSKTSKQFQVGGEPKCLVQAADSGLVYTVLYPSTAVVALSPNDFSVRELGRINNTQYRPSDIVHDVVRQQLVISSGGAPRTNQGAVTFIDLASGEFQVRKDILVGMNPAALWRDGRVVYVSGDARGEQNPPPDREWGEIAAVDLDTREVLWRKEMVGHPRLNEICVHQGLLYVLPKARPGNWFALDLETREIALQGTVSAYGDIRPYQGRVYSYTHFSDDITVLPDRRGGTEQVIYSQLPRGAWFNNPVLTFDPVRGGTWGVYEKDLAFFPLPH